MSAKTKPKRSCLSSISSARKAELLTKKLDVEKVALRLRMMEEEDAQCRQEEMEFQKLSERQRMQKEELCLDEELARARVNAERRQKVREMQQKAREQQLEYEHALKEIEYIENEENKSMREGLAELPSCKTLEDRIRDWVMLTLAKIIWQTIHNASRIGKMYYFVNKKRIWVIKVMTLM